MDKHRFLFSFLKEALSHDEHRFKKFRAEIHSQYLAMILLPRYYSIKIVENHFDIVPLSLRKSKNAISKLALD